MLNDFALSVVRDRIFKSCYLNPMRFDKLFLFQDSNIEGSPRHSLGSNNSSNLSSPPSPAARLGGAAATAEGAAPPSSSSSS